MTVPSRIEAARLLWSLDPPAWFVRHVTAVAEVAGWLAMTAERRGIEIDRGAVEAAALLHDVDKLLPSGDPRRALPHGEGSAAWLGDHGASELADLVRDHPVTRLADDRAANALLDARLEVGLVAYADKRAGQRLEPMAARFASWRRRYPAGPDGGGWDDVTARRVAERATALERRICHELGNSPADVRRVRWVADAVAAVRSPGTTGRSA